MVRRPRSSRSSATARTAQRRRTGWQGTLESAVNTIRNSPQMMNAITHGLASMGLGTPSSTALSTVPSGPMSLMDLGPAVGSPIARYRTTLQRRGKIMGQARYRGKFRKTRRKGARAAGKFTTCHTEEVNGTVTDSDCVYLIHASADVQVIIAQLVREMTRKLLERAGFVIHSENEVLQANAGLSDSTGFTIRVFEQNNNNNTVGLAASTAFVAASTLNTVSAAISSAFYNFSNGATNPSSINGVELTQMCLFDNKTTESLVATVDLREEHIIMYSKSALKVQNRTLSGDGTASTDNVNANPLVGYCYDFNGVPKAKPRNMYQFNRILTGRGVTLIKASTISDASLKEPPLPRVFWNCHKSSKIRLQPGEIKEAHISHKLSMNILKLLKKIRYSVGPLPDILNFHSPFKHQMLAMEEVINVDPEESITVSYEIDRKTYIRSITKRKKGTTLGSFQQTSYNNI